MRFKFSLLAAATALVPAMTASAQSWSSNVSPNNNPYGSGQYWDHQSDDGKKCNIGYVLNGTAGTAGASCANQRPSGWLPYSGDNPTHYLNNGSGSYQKFSFASGTYTFSLLPGAKLGGEIAGANTSWGYYTGSGGGGDIDLSTNGDLYGSGAFSVNITSPWGLWVQTVDGARSYSGIDKQFALFGFNGSGTFSGNVLDYADDSRYIVGLEDTRDYSKKTCEKYSKWGNCSKWHTQSWESDWDYNDIAFQISTPGRSTVPEPSSYALMVAGLGALVVTARRRKS